jgi:hypothetical protein
MPGHDSAGTGHRTGPGTAAESSSRDLRVSAVLAAAAAAVALLTGGCGGAPEPQTLSHPTASVQARLTPFQACQKLLADVTRNLGVPDIATLRHIADHVSAARLAADARTAVRDIGHTGIAPVALLLLRDDCARAGVRIPAP